MWSVPCCSLVISAGNWGDRSLPPPANLPLPPGGGWSLVAELELGGRGAWVVVPLPMLLQGLRHGGGLLGLCLGFQQAGESASGVW